MNRLLYVCSLLLAVGLMSTLPALAHHDVGQSNIPTDLRVAAGYERVLTSVGRGVQIYDCVAGAWKFKEPQAEIFRKESGKKVALHYAGPTWESIHDGSKVVGAVDVRLDAPDPQHDIQWLRLRATSNSGHGLFARVVYIQRLDTKGGVAPSGPCITGETVKIPYRATYNFWAPR